MENFKKELKKNIKNLTALFLSYIFISFNVSIASAWFDKQSDPKVVWALDVAIYSFIFGTLLSALYVLFSSSKLSVNVKIKGFEDDINTISLKDSETKKIILNIKCSGKHRKVTKNLELIFPDWIDPQIREGRHIKIVEDENKVIVDLESLTKDKEPVDFNRPIPIDIMVNDLVCVSEAGVTDFLKPHLKLNPFLKIIRMNLDIKGMEIKYKGAK